MNIISKWKDKIAHYIDVRLSLIKIAFIERVSHIMSFFLFLFITIFLGVSSLIFVGIGIGEYFCELLDSTSAGFFVTAGFYILLILFLFLIRKTILNLFSGIFIRILTAVDKSEADESKNSEEKINVE